MPTRPDTFMHNVEHSLTASEAMDLYDKAEVLDKKKDELDKRLKQETLGRKTEIRQLEAEAARMREAAQRRMELKPVECREEKRGSQMFIVRCDNGQDVYQRALTEDELQDNFPGMAAKEDLDLPLEPDYTPSKKSAKVASEKKPKKGKKRG